MVKATCKGQVVAESDDTVVVAGNHYFPRASVCADLLQDSPTTSVCGWKGAARYHHVVVDGVVHEDIAWYYDDPKPAAKSIAGRIAFWRDVDVG